MFREQNEKNKQRQQQLQNIKNFFCCLLFLGGVALFAVYKRKDKKAIAIYLREEKDFAY